jgi:hypothetical protein
MSRTIRNTTAEALAHPSPIYGLPGMIEASESAGQAALVESESLPSQISGRATFEALGFTFGQPYPDDKNFLPATLPAGWSKRSTDHAMWSEIVDEKGRVRAGVFYKAAFYDRRAHMSLRGRYRINAEYSRGYTSVRVDVKADDAEIFRTETFTGTDRQCFEAEDRLRAVAREWLTMNRPGWDDPIKQWDDEPMAAAE